MPSTTTASSPTAAAATQAAAAEPVYWGEEKMVLTIDIGNSFSSISLTHIIFGQTPTSSIRIVSSFPSFPLSSPPPVPPSRTPSAILFDARDRPRAFGTECLMPEAKVRVKEDGWLMVEAFKSQLNPVPVPPSSTKRLATKLVSKRASATVGAGAASKRDGMVLAPATPIKGGLLSAPGAIGSPLTRTVTPEGIVDAVHSQDQLEWEDVAKPAKPKKTYKGPLIANIYGHILKHLVACARAWFGETTPQGEEIFTRLWSTCIFVLSHPADWGPTELAVLKQGMEADSLLMHGFEVGRLVFVKEPAAIAYFAKQHTRDSDWLQPNTSFVLCDASAHTISVIGYTVGAVSPKLKLRAFEPVSRLDLGANALLKALQTRLSSRLHRTKFSKPHHITSILDEIVSKVLPKFSGEPSEHFRIKFANEGSEKSAGVVDGWIEIEGKEIEEAFVEVVKGVCVRLSSVVVKGNAKHILLAGGFGESPYLQRRIREFFAPQGVSLVVPDIPTHTAVAEGAARFFLAETVTQRPLLYSLGISTAVDWSSNWVKGSERELFTSVSGQRYVLGKWTTIVEKGINLDPSQPITKTYNVKHVISEPNADPVFRVELFAHDPDSEPQTDGWMTDLSGKPHPNFESLGTVEADLTSLIALSKVQGNEPGRQFVYLDFQLMIYVGKSSIEACVAWQERGNGKRGQYLSLPSHIL